MLGLLVILSLSLYLRLSLSLSSLVITDVLLFPIMCNMWGLIWFWDHLKALYWKCQSDDGTSDKQTDRISTCRLEPSGRRGRVKIVFLLLFHFQDLGYQFLFFFSIFKILETNFSFSSQFSRFCLCATPSSVIKNFGLILTSAIERLEYLSWDNKVWLTVWLLFHFSLSTLSQIRISILSFCSQDWRTAFEMSLSTLVNEYIHIRQGVIWFQKEFQNTKWQKITFWYPIFGSWAGFFEVLVASL